MTLRVADRGGTADKPGLRTVEGADSFQPSDEIRHVGTENATVHMELIDDHVLQVFKKLDPLGVVREDARVQHVRVRDHDMSRSSQLRSRRRRRVPVIGESFYRGSSFLDESVHFRQLVLAQGLGGEDVKRPGGIVFQDGVQDRNVVAKCFPRGRGGNGHNIGSGKGGFNGFCLMAVKPFDTPSG